MAVPSDVTGAHAGPRQLCFGDTISLYAEADDVHGVLSPLGYDGRAGTTGRASMHTHLAPTPLKAAAALQLDRQPCRRPAIRRRHAARSTQVSGYGLPGTLVRVGVGEGPCALSSRWRWHILATHGCAGRLDCLFKVYPMHRYNAQNLWKNSRSVSNNLFDTVMLKKLQVRGQGPTPTHARVTSLV